MKTQIELIPDNLKETISASVGAAEDALFFDIESTGLSPKSAQVYLIGCAAMEGGDWVLRQWFAQGPCEEEAILEAFLKYAGQFRRLIHFNGTTFDLPFLQTRCRKYGLRSPLPDMEQLDLYRRISPLKNALKLPNCRQKTLEEFLGIFREDPFNGGQLIELYRVYVGRQDERLLKVLLLHNADDIRGMLSILPVLSFPALFSGGVQAQGAEVSSYTPYAEGTGQMQDSAPLSHTAGSSRRLSQPAQKELLIRLTLDCPLPVPLAVHGNGCFFSGEGKTGLLKVPVIQDELKYFYPDYKNYSYLPAEDRAIHKSVAIYVDKSCRVPATPETCYTRKTGEFAPLPGISSGTRKKDASARVDTDLFSHVFRRSAKGKEAFLLLEEILPQNEKLCGNEMVYGNEKAYENETVYGNENERGRAASAPAPADGAASSPSRMTEYARLVLAGMQKQ